MKLNILRNKAMSTSFKRLINKENFLGEKKSFIDVIKKRQVNSLTLDKFCKKTN